ncbi:tripartite tricarboxylate transporter substrate binding protein [Ensifer adhaerens]|uniref:Bug family tripartite tricarboxylate transporter substrate binding protein n=1 Tax=Ensifer adhaerens TaxID=106592 RepID=UPI0023AA155B|nr:tripartite tricarboxylate transporter substrate binding protein [Ensifer adhaerens]WDZ76240.1 tripartite tricarboxylate transporter substrate binding protein [Ensifer adhaerens]
MTRFTRRSVVICATALAATFTLSSPIAAQEKDFPSKPITVIVPFGAGGASDTLARAVTSAAGSSLGQPMVVELMPGASGVIGTTNFVRNAKPDGYTLILVGTSASTTVPHAQKVAYDPIKDFAFLIGISLNTEVLAVRTDFPADNAEEFVKYAKENPGKTKLGHPGTGGEDWAVIQMMSREFGSKIVDVPYDGAGPAATSAAGGHIDGVVGSLASVTPYVDAKKLKILAVFSNEASKNLPDVQSFTQIGYKNVVLNSRLGIAAPKGTPPEIVEKLHQGLKATIENDSFKSLAQRLNFNVVYMGPDNYREALSAEYARMGAAFKQ